MNPELIPKPGRIEHLAFGGEEISADDAAKKPNIINSKVVEILLNPKKFNPKIAEFKNAEFKSS